MASRRKSSSDDGDRPMMDMGGTAPETPADFMAAQADDDRKSAKEKHANKGLRSAREMVACMTKSVAHGLASDSDAVKASCLEELAELGNAVRDACRAAIRKSASENRNVQSEE